MQITSNQSAAYSVLIDIVYNTEVNEILFNNVGFLIGPSDKNSEKMLRSNRRTVDNE